MTNINPLDDEQMRALMTKCRNADRHVAALLAMTNDCYRDDGQSGLLQDPFHCSGGQTMDRSLVTMGVPAYSASQSLRDPLPLLNSMTFHGLKAKGRGSLPVFLCTTTLLVLSMPVDRKADRTLPSGAGVAALLAMTNDCYRDDGQN